MSKGVTPMDAIDNAEGYGSPNRSRRQSRRLSRNVTYVLGPDEEPPADMDAMSGGAAAAEKLINRVALAAEDRHEEMLVTEKEKKVESLSCRQTDQHEEYSVQYFGVQPRLLIDMLYERFLDRVEEFMQKLFDYTHEKKNIVVNDDDAEAFCKHVMDDLDAHFDVSQYDAALKCVFRLPNTQILASDFVQHEISAGGENDDCSEAALDLKITRLEERLVATRLESARLRADTERVQTAGECNLAALRSLEAERKALNAFARSMLGQYDTDIVVEKRASTADGLAHDDAKRCLQVLKHASGNIATLYDHLQCAFP